MAGRGQCYGVLRENLQIARRVIVIVGGGRRMPNAIETHSQ